MVTNQLHYGDRGASSIALEAFVDSVEFAAGGQALVDGGHSGGTDGVHILWWGGG